MEYGFYELQMGNVADVFEVTMNLGEREIIAHGIIGAPLDECEINKMITYFIRGVQHFGIDIPKEMISMREMHSACDIMYNSEGLKAEEVLQKVMRKLVEDYV